MVFICSFTAKCTSKLLQIGTRSRRERLLVTEKVALVEEGQVQDFNLNSDTD